MNVYRVRHRMREFQKKIKDKANEHLMQFGLEVELAITRHLTDRLFDRSKNLEADIFKVEDMLEELFENHLGLLFHMAYYKTEDSLIVYRTYRNNLQDCIMLALSVLLENGKVKVVVRTFMPAAPLTYVRQRYNVRLVKTKKFRYVSDLQKMLYSDICPEALKILR